MVEYKYEQELSKFDWDFQSSDDHWYYCQMRDKLALLVLLREEMDPNSTIWNRWASRFYQVGTGDNQPTT